ncbi:uncharacterized protein HMPREF1541_05912 [Cyphellophora europaea CBS 101466]|uniref:Acyl-CoA dehydrogenase/oxidase C-terminal domain-containing protein n=1 Tax=Cyphellophora europaea (strain CBS 101466) TaxID=1220924 RepID=W2RT40_CYPE1|nr:uncharacterized protein HMPREF1541_05912 [Cyphellophora europaea CBS 101466]ETN39686.1 hypothetical protein HMPREF1541_05912 [Cyphellophora europaea CBS 101466]
MATSTPTPSSATAGFFQPFPAVQPSYTSPTHNTTNPNTASKANPTDDPTIPRLLALYLPQPTPPTLTAHLHALSRQTLSPTTLHHASLADTSPPTLSPLTTFGAPNTAPSQLQTSLSWQHLLASQTRHGIVGHGYAQAEHHDEVTEAVVRGRGRGAGGWNRRVYQFLLNHVWDPSSAGVVCPAAMSDGAAALLREQVRVLEEGMAGNRDREKKAVFQHAYERLVTLDPERGWRAGQWMTERSGGSDVRETETVATRLGAGELRTLKKSGVDVDAVGMELGDWEVSGFKWFSSATDADCALLLAKTAGGKGKGRVSCFYAPVKRREVGEGSRVVMNGVRISRLKNKLGTKAVPTAELELKGMRAWLVGEEGEGTRVISRLLNITRLHTAKGGVACWGRGLAIARAWAACRPVKNPEGGKVLLVENRQHVRWMADETVKYRAYTSLYMFGVALLGVSEIDGLVGTTKADELGLIPKDTKAALSLLRLLTPVMKQACSLAAVQGLRECMESMGGVGYCENTEDNGVLNVARLLRDANVNPIWEGTTSVLAEDLLRALRVGSGQARQTLDGIVGTWLKTALGGSRATEVFAREIQTIQGRYERLQKLISTKSEDELLWQGRVVVRLLADITCAVLLLKDALADGDEIAVAVARRWALMIGGGDTTEADDWEAEAQMDRRIFMGEMPAGHSSEFKGRAKL